MRVGTRRIVVGLLRSIALRLDRFEFLKHCHHQLDNLFSATLIGEDGQRLPCSLSSDNHSLISSFVFGDKYCPSPLGSQSQPQISVSELVLILRIFRSLAPLASSNFAENDG